MTLRDIFRFEELTLIEILTLGAISIVLAFVILPEKDVPTTINIITEDQFNEYPLIAWKDTDEKGDIIKIKYRVHNTETYIKVYDINGVVVHKQPFQRDPWEDGRSRDFTYDWMLYATEDYGDEIPPGDYQIQVCHKYSRNVVMVLDIII